MSVDSFAQTPLALVRYAVVPDEYGEAVAAPSAAIRKHQEDSYGESD